MPSIILKKTFKIKPSWTHEKSFSFHGPIKVDVIKTVNDHLARSIRFTQGSNRPQFKMDTAGHYFAQMNHDCQKHHEEDIIVTIINVMEVFGWDFRFQYDSESSSMKVTGPSETSREMFIFSKKDS